MTAPCLICSCNIDPHTHGECAKCGHTMIVPDTFKGTPLCFNCCDTLWSRLIERLVGFLIGTGYVLAVVACIAVFAVVMTLLGFEPSCYGQAC